MTTVMFGILGALLDRAPRDERRWERWRPTVDACRHEDLVIDRLELIVEDTTERLAVEVIDDLRNVSPETVVNVHRVSWANPWDFEEVYGALHDLARGYPFQPDDEEYLVHITTGTHVAQICLFLLTESRHLPARLLQTSPPRRREQAGIDPGSYAIIDLDLSRYDQIASRFEAEHQQGLAFLKSGIDTRNPAFNRLIERIEQVAIASRSPILLTGPTGAGKSLLARRTFELKRTRRQVDGRFVEVNCATLRGDQAASTLFGHKKGAFTGATADRAGLLKGADRGVVFLDEIGELGLDEQAMLLRALEERRFLPVGADQEIESDFQLIAGTNRDLADAVRQGRFRDDLLARINLWTFELPGLAERREDIEPNLEYELRRWTDEHGKRVTFNKEARDAFLRFALSPEATWPANFRDFNAAITRMATLAAGRRIAQADVDEEVARLLAQWRGRGSDDASLRRVLGDEAVAELDRFDRVQLADVLTVCGACESLSAAGRALFGASRRRRTTTNDADRLRKYLSRFDLNFTEIKRRLRDEADSD